MLSLLIILLSCGLGLLIGNPFAISPSSACAALEPARFRGSRLARWDVGA